MSTTTGTKIAFMERNTKDFLEDYSNLTSEENSVPSGSTKEDAALLRDETIHPAFEDPDMLLLQS